MDTNSVETNTSEQITAENNTVEKKRLKKTPLVAATVLAAALALTACSGSTGAPSSSTQTSGASGTSASSAAATSTGTSAATASSSSTGGPTSGPQSTTDGLVAGFPTSLIPLMPGATIKSSNYDSSQAIATASLVATSSETAAAIGDYYTKVYVEQNFTPLPATSVDGVTSLSFTRTNGTETVNVSVGPAASGVTINVGAHVLPASMK